MEYELLEDGPCRKKLLLKFSASDVDGAFDASYADINTYVKINGFRKGKAPLRALRNRFSKEAAVGAREDLTEKNLKEVADKEKLQILGQPTSKSRGALPAPGTPFTIDLEFDVMPEFDLPEYKDIEVAKQAVDVDDASVEESIERYRKLFASYETVDGPALEGDVLRVDFIAKVEGEEIMSMDEQRLRVEGEILFGLPCPELVGKFTGAKAGDLVVLGITLPADHPNPEFRGRDADVEVSVKQVERGTLMELNDEFAQNIGMGTMEQFRERIRANLLREAFIAAKQKEEDEIITTLLERVAFGVPRGMVEFETAELVEAQRRHLARQGAKPGEAMNAQLEKYRPEAAKQAERKVRWSILSRKIGEKEGIQVTNEDLAAQVDALAQTYNTTPAKIIQRIREFDGVGPMMAEILSMKVIQLITRNAKGEGTTITTETGSVNADAAKIASEPEKETAPE